MTASGRLSKYGLRFVALFYLTALLLLPIGVALVKTFEDGIGEVIKQITEPDAIHALKMSLLTVIIAVPLNTVFGIASGAFAKSSALTSESFNMPRKMHSTPGCPTWAAFASAEARIMTNCIVIDVSIHASICFLPTAVSSVRSGSVPLTLRGRPPASASHSPCFEDRSSARRTLLPCSLGEAIER
ncbi:MAG TPA: hypothetical protein P5138_07570, partial [Solirubrobacterales bacterium]|nr:hypothetical protein [Solirubrobacterales bacterium]